MAVLEFRPHTFQYRENSSVNKGYTDEKGDFHPVQQSFSSEIECNAVPSSGRAEISDAEGRKIRYSFTIYTTPEIHDFGFGDIIRLNREGIIHELVVKGFHRYKHMVKIWV